jgi:hypothetical protein
MVTGNTPDITEYTEFSWYDPIFCYDDLPFPDAKRNIARWLGVAHRIGQALCFWILTNTGQVVARTTVQKLSNEELLLPKEEIKAFDKVISEHLPVYGADIGDLFLIPKDTYDLECDEP